MNKFDLLNKKYEDLVYRGTFHSDARDKVDTINCSDYTDYVSSTPSEA